MTFADRVIDFTLQLRIPAIPLPPGFEWLFPYENPATVAALSTFYRAYFSDTRPRTFILGINPGRFGAGVTGVPFTDPLRLETQCGIANDFPRKPELSSQFVWEFIGAYGGAKAFFHDFYITSLSPLGFVKEGKNINYYDDRSLQRAVEPYIVANLTTQLAFGARRHAAICLGEGQNYAMLKKLNDQHDFFAAVEPLPHPRFIMQYRRKQLDAYVQRYIDVLHRLAG